MASRTSGIFWTFSFRSLGPLPIGRIFCGGLEWHNSGREGVSLPIPDISFFSDASDVGWGGPSGRKPCLGPLISSSDRSLLQHERAVDSSVRPSGLGTSPCGTDGGSVWRPYHHSRLSPSFRRDVLLHSERQGEGNPPMSGDQPFPSPASVHHGLVQCHSGHSESSQSGDWVRVDSPSGGSRSPCPQMAGSDRSFCDVPDRQTSCVLLPSLRFEGGGDGRSSPALRQSPGLCLSSDRHYKESSCRTEVFKELRVDSHRSVLASGGLVPGPAGTVVRYSHTNCPFEKIF